MPRYHFHIQLEDRLIMDGQGVDLPDLRDTQSPDTDEEVGALWADVLQFTECLPQRTTIITDELGRVVFVLSL